MNGEASDSPLYKELHGCGIVGWAVASGPGHPQFDSSHRQRQLLYRAILNADCIKKTKTDNKRGREWHIKIETIVGYFFSKWNTKVGNIFYLFDDRFK